MGFILKRKSWTKNVAPNLFAQIGTQVTLPQSSNDLTTTVYGPMVADIHLTGGGGSGGGALPSAEYGIAGTQARYGEAGQNAEKNKPFMLEVVGPAGGVVFQPGRKNTPLHNITFATSGTWGNWTSDAGHDGDSCTFTHNGIVRVAAGGVAGRGAYISEISGASNWSSGQITEDGSGGFGVYPAYGNNSGTAISWRSSNSRGRIGACKITLRSF